MVQQPIEPGNIVRYHGSDMRFRDQEFKVLGFIENPRDPQRGYYISATENPLLTLRNVHRDSLTLLSTQ
jgi:hypothetical protein